MRAVLVDRFGGPEVLRLVDLADPEPGPGEVLVHTAASDVLYVDTMVRAGNAVGIFPIRPPYIPGNGIGGDVSAVGPDVDPALIGRLVVAHTGGPGGGGGYAERTVVAAADVVEVPPDVDLHTALAVLHDGPTALRILRRVAVRPGEPVLVLGAAGGMGVVLVQLLHAAGAFVVGAARGKAKLDVVDEAGADVAVDYDRPDWTSAVLDATHGAGPIAVLDGVGGPLGREAFDIVRGGGRFSAHGAPSGSFAPIDPDTAHRRHVTITTLTDLAADPTPRHQLIREAVALVADDAVHPLVGQTFPLRDARTAHAAIAARETIAKTLLLVD